MRSVKVWSLDQIFEVYVFKKTPALFVARQVRVPVAENDDGLVVDLSLPLFLTGRFFEPFEERLLYKFIFTLLQKCYGFDHEAPPEGTVLILNSAYKATTYVFRGKVSGVKFQHIYFVPPNNVFFTIEKYSEPGGHASIVPYGIQFPRSDAHEGR